MTIDASQSFVIERKIHNTFAYSPLHCYTKNYPEIHNYTTPIHSLGIRIPKDHQLDNLMTFFLETSTTALFDAGALLKDYPPNSNVAKRVLAPERYKCVVYYDDKTNVIVYQMDTGRIWRDLPVDGQFAFLETKYNLKNHEIFLYLDQAHCFGTNVDVKNLSAICVVTFSVLVYTKTFYQTLLRARKLLNGISVDNSFTFLAEPRHQIRIFVSSILQYDQEMPSTLGENEMKKLALKTNLFSEVIKSDKKAALESFYFCTFELAQEGSQGKRPFGLEIILFQGFEDPLVSHLS